MTIILHQDFASVAEHWRTLEGRNSVSVHQTMAWCRAWAEAVRAPFLILDYRHRGNSILLPLEIASGRPFRIARPLATRFSNLNVPIADLNGEFESPHFLTELRGTLMGRIDILVFNKTPMEWRGHINPLSGLTRIPRVDSSFQLELEPVFQQTLAKLDALKRMKVFRATLRKLEAAGGWHYEEIIDPVRASAALGLFFDQKAVRFRAMGLPNVFASPSVLTFFHRLVASPMQDDGHVLRLHVLRMCGPDGPPLAIAGISTKGDYAVAQFGSVDVAAIPSASPGEFLHHLIIEKLCEKQLRLFDFGVGDQFHKRRWCNVETRQFDFVLPLSHLGSAVMQFHRATSITKRFVKERPAVYQAVQRLRSKLRSGS